MILESLALASRTTAPVWLWRVGGLLGLLSGCFGGGGHDDPAAELEDTPISLPYDGDTRPLDRSPAEEKFVIRSAVGAKEYAIEIPGAARDYDVQVPIAEAGPAGGHLEPDGRPKGLGSPVQTDQELLSAMPRLDESRGKETGLMDQAFGVTRSEEHRQAPSFTLGLARINRYYKERNLEYCLVEINQLLMSYPNAIQLYKMKGTVLLKMRQPRLAEAAWVKAQELAPADRSIKKALDRLRRRFPSEAPPADKVPATP